MHILVKQAYCIIPVRLPWEPEGEPINVFDITNTNSRYIAKIDPATMSLLVLSPDEKSGLTIPMSMLIGYGDVSSVMPQKRIVLPAKH